MSLAGRGAATALAAFLAAPAAAKNGIVAVSTAAAFPPEAAAVADGSATESPAAEKPAPGKPVKLSPLIQQYYQEALQSYAAGDYRQAIIKWTAIMKEAPEQTTAATMILDARGKIRLATRERRRHAFDFIAAGQYQKAFKELQALLDQDPGDPQLQALQNRLSGVIKLAPALIPTSKAAHAAVLGLKGYLALPPDLTLAHNGLRYAAEITPDEELYRKLLGLLIAEFPMLSTLDPVTPGMKFLEYKHYVALHQIYDGKYHTAILTLDEILALNPGDLTALKRLGSAYYSLGRMEEARSAWIAALRLSPQDKTLQRFLAKTHAPANKKAPADTEATP
ncbi:MAG: tetratricopeptide repeat protein [Elusimicrobiota bacterium]